MKNIKIYSASSALALCLLAGCASTTPQHIKVEPVQTLIADTNSCVALDLNFRVPKNALKKRSRIIIIPQLTKEDSVWAEYRPLVLDAPLFAKKMKRKRVLENTTDDYLEYSHLADPHREYVLPYKEQIQLPSEYAGAKIVAMLSTDGCGECSLVDTLDMAYLSTTYQLLQEPSKRMELALIEPEFVIRPKIAKGEGEARLQFKINLHHIDLSLHRNEEEMNGMLETLSRIVNDSLAKLNTVDIYGMASADGSFGFNTQLASNRAASAKQWLVKKLHLKRQMAQKFSIGSMPEGWHPVLQAMRADQHPDTTKVAAILNQYTNDNDDVAEKYIRRLTCWHDIKEKYLQKDRKVVYRYSYTVKSFTTDAELLRMYHLRPDAFNHEELLRVATLKESSKAKQEVYRTLLRFFPDSEIAAHNLSILLMKEGHYEEAMQTIESFHPTEPALVHTQAVIYAKAGKTQKAESLFASNLSYPDSRYSLGMLKAQQHRFGEAYSLLKEFADSNTAIVSLCVNDHQQAHRQMNQHTDQTPLAEYIRAVIAARSGQQEDLYNHLRRAVEDPQLRQRAANDVEFINYQNDVAFNAIVSVRKGGKKQ